MSYVQRKTRLFKDAGDADIVRKRSEGRMKIYPSATDARAWCDISEDRRQYILELIRKGSKGLAIGKYIPIEVIIDTLLANKNSEIERLQDQIDELQQLLDLYSQILTDDQKKKLEEIKSGMGKLGEDLETIRSGNLSTIPEETGTSDLDEDARRRAAREAAAETAARNAAEADAASRAAEREAARDAANQDAARRAAEKEAARKAAEQEAARRAAEKEASRKAAEQEAARRAAEKEAARKAAEQEAARKAAEEAARKATQKNRDKDAEIQNLKDALKAKEAYCEEQHNLAEAAIKQLENIKGIIEERDDLLEKLRMSQVQLETLKRQMSQTGTDAFASCEEEIEELERQIEAMRQGKLTPQDEAVIIRKEVEVLKRYCAKLGSIQEENQLLKQRIKQMEAGIMPDTFGDTSCEMMDGLKRELQDKLQKLDVLSRERDSLRDRTKLLEDELRSYGDLPEAVQVYKMRSQMLDDVVKERDSLSKRLAELKGLDAEAEELKRKADRVDELERLLALLQREYDEIANAKSGCDKLEKQLDKAMAERELLQAQLDQAFDELNELRNNAGNMDVLRLERDRLQMRLNELAGMEEEYQILMCKLKCLENVKKERDMYKAKYDEMAGMECECEMLRAQVDRCKCIEKERDALHKQTCELECCIAEQEDEIKKLASQVERLSEDREEEESLSFEELHILHTKTCNAAANMLEARSRQMQQTCQNADDKLSLMRRVATLENELMRKQKHAQQKNSALQMNVKLAQQKLDELKKSLAMEKQKNSDLQSKINIHSKAVVNLQVERDLIHRQKTHYEEKLQHFVFAYEQERERVKKLQDELERERHHNDHLSQQLEKAKASKKKDNEALKSMKVMLEKTLHNEMKLRMKLGQKPRVDQHHCTCPCAMTHPTKDITYVPKTKVRTCQFQTEFTLPDSAQNKMFTHHCSCGCKSRDTDRTRFGQRSASTYETLDIDES